MPHILTVNAAIVLILNAGQHPVCEVNRRIGLHDSNGVAHACDSDTRCSRPSSVT